MTTPTERFRKFCEDNDLKAKDVAEKMGRSVHTVRHWFSGKRHPIPEETLELIELKLAKKTKKPN